MKKHFYVWNLILIKIKSYLRISYILLNYNDACFKCVIRGIFGKTPSKDTIKYMKWLADECRRTDDIVKLNKKRIEEKYL